jgi:hypothetical protein
MAERLTALLDAVEADNASARLGALTDTERLHEMIDEFRRMREQCEPRSGQNPRCLRHSNAASALRWVIDDLTKENRA